MLWVPLWCVIDSWNDCSVENGWRTREGERKVKKCGTLLSLPHQRTKKSSYCGVRTFFILETPPHILHYTLHYFVVAGRHTCELNTFLQCPRMAVLLTSKKYVADKNWLKFTHGCLHAAESKELSYEYHRVCSLAGLSLSPFPIEHNEHRHKRQKQRIIYEMIY